MSDRRDERIVRVLSKWPLMAAFWAVQSVLLFVGGAVWQQLAESAEPEPGKYYGVLDAGSVVRLMGEPAFLQHALPTIGGIAALQFLLLLPVRQPRGRREQGTALWMSMGAAAFGIIGMTTALGFALTHGLKQAGVPEVEEAFGSVGVYRAVAVWCVVCWLIATPLLVSFCRGRLGRGARWEDVLAAVSARLFLGTWIEVAAIMPLDVLVRRKDSCYCWAGTFFALTILGGVGVALVGPVILLPALARRRKRWYAGRCDACGYDVSNLMERGGLGRCPECGAGWKPDQEQPEK